MQAGEAIAYIVLRVAALLGLAFSFAGALIYAREPGATFAASVVFGQVSAAAIFLAMFHFAPALAKICVPAHQPADSLRPVSISALAAAGTFVFGLLLVADATALAFAAIVDPDLRTASELWTNVSSAAVGGVLMNRARAVGTAVAALTSDNSNTE